MISFQYLHLNNKQFNIFGLHLGLTKVSSTLSLQTHLSFSKRFMLSGAAGKGPKLPTSTPKNVSEKPTIQHSTSSPASSDLQKASETCNFPVTNDPTKSPTPEYYDKVHSQKPSDSKQFQELKDANVHAHKSLLDAHDHLNLPEKPSPSSPTSTSSTTTSASSTPSMPTTPQVQSTHPVPTSPEPLSVQTTPSSPSSPAPTLENQQLVNNMIASSIKATHSKTPTLDSTQGLGVALKSHFPTSDSSMPTPLPTPNDSHPLMITDGSEFNETNNFTEQACNPSDDIISVFEITNSSPDAISEPLPIPSPPPPPLPSDDPLSKSSPNSDISFKQELEQAVAERQQRAAEISDKLIQLTAFNLYDPERDKLKSDFFRYLKKSIPSEAAIESTSIECTQMSLGLLTIKNPEDTIYLTGIQNHVTIVYTVVDGQKVVGGYLTSEKGQNHIKLSDSQPFPRNHDSKPLNSPQYFKPVKPFIIKDHDLEPLPEETYKLGLAYIQQKEIQDALQTEFKSRISSELKKPIKFYDGQGITLQNINDVLSAIDQEKSSEAKKLFEKYENKLKKKGEVNANLWLEKLKNDNKGAYPYVKKFIDDKNS